MGGSSGYIYVTQEGLDKMKAELKTLKGEERPKIVEAIRRARELGDLSENAEYHAAKERQVHLERKISELEEKVTRARIFDKKHLDDSVAYLLSHVTIRDVSDGEEITYQLVSPEEADADNDRISVQSPIGKALLGTKVGDHVKIEVPSGVLEYEILKIELK